MVNKGGFEGKGRVACVCVHVHTHLNDGKASCAFVIKCDELTPGCLGTFYMFVCVRACVCGPKKGHSKARLGTHRTPTNQLNKAIKRKKENEDKVDCASLKHRLMCLYK